MSIKFQYKYIESEKERAYIKMKTHEIRSLLPKLPGSRVPGEDYFTIGDILLDIRSRIRPKILFYAWLQSEVNISKGVAAKYMKIVKVFSEKYNTVKHVPYTTLHELTYPSYPPSIIAAIEDGGYVPSLTRCQEIRAERTTSRDAILQDLYAQANALTSTPQPKKMMAESPVFISTPQIKVHYDSQETHLEIEALREDIKYLKIQCSKAQQERDALIDSIRKLIVK